MSGVLENIFIRLETAKTQGSTGYQNAEEKKQEKSQMIIYKLQVISFYCN